jgi:hypothetical protein
MNPRQLKDPILEVTIGDWSGSEVHLASLVSKPFE